MKKKILAAVLAVTMMATTFVPVRHMATATTTVEPGATNITFDTARDLVFNTSIAEELSTSDRKRYYKFSLSEASVLTVGTNASDMDFVIYDKSRTAVYNKTYIWSTTIMIYLTGGDYYLGTETANPYTMFVSVDSLSESFKETYDINNDTMATSSEITVGKQYKGVLAQNDDKDYYKFTLTDPSNLTVNITNTTDDYLKYSIYDSLGNQSYYNSVSSKADDTIQLAAGTYYLAITKDDYRIKAIGSYNFSLSAVKIVEKPTTTTTKPSTTTVNKPSTTKTQITKPKKVTIKSMKNKAHRKIIVKWKKLSGVSGYKLQFSNKKNFKKIIMSGKYSSRTSSASYVNAKKKKTYYVRVRAYIKNGSRTYYGDWSKTKKIKVK